MLDAARMGPLSWVSAALAVIILWELAKWALAVVSGSNSARGNAAGSLAVKAPESDDYKDLPVPPEPHVELVIDPPGELHCSNPKEPYSYENDFCSGTYLFFHPPAGEGTAQGPCGFDYKDYFDGKSRLWEIRIRINFKRAPSTEEDLFFGIELSDYVPLSIATKQAQRVVIAAIKQAMGGLYQSPGDDPKKVMGERERPCCVLPMWAFDQFIETPAGQEPPSLSDPRFPEMGKKRYRRVAEYAKEIGVLQQSFSVGPTYTLAFWGNSRFLDVINWTLIGIPLATPLDFNKFAGRPPVSVVFYGLARAPGGKEAEKRHVQTRKSYYFRAAIWSSLRRPDRSLFEWLTAASSGGAHPLSPAKKKKSLRRRIAGFFKGLDGCTTRTRE